MATTFLKPFTKQRKLAVLRQARQLIARPRGWAKGVWFDRAPGKDYDALCLGAACQQAAKDLGLIEGALQEDAVAKRVSLSKLVREKTGHSHVPSFNDAKSTRKKDVLAIIDEKIAELEA